MFSKSLYQFIGLLHICCSIVQYALEKNDFRLRTGRYLLTFHNNRMMEIRECLDKTLNLIILILIVNLISK